MFDRHVIHQSLNRHQLMMGADRILVILASVLCGSMGVAIGWWGIPICFLLWCVLIAGLQRMAKADPLMRSVYLRHVSYRGFYPAKAALNSRGPQLPLGWM